MSALPLVNQEPETIAWFALRMGPSTSASSTPFRARRAVTRILNGEVAKALMAKASELLAKAPEIHKVDVLADKLPG